MNTSTSPNHSSNNKARWAVGAVLSVAVAAGAVALTGFASSAPIAVASPPTAQEFDYTSSLKGETATLPAGIADVEFFDTADLGTLRLLATDTTSDYWSVMRESRLCLVISVESEVSVAASCVDPKEFQSGGAAIRLLTPSTASEAYLLPDTVAASVGTSVVTVDPFDAKRSGAEVSAEGFELRKLPAVQSDEIPEGLRG